MVSLFPTEGEIPNAKKVSRYIKAAHLRATFQKYFVIVIGRNETCSFNNCYILFQTVQNCNIEDLSSERKCRILIRQVFFGDSCHYEIC